MEIQLSGGSIEELRQRILATYGPEARIVSAEAVTVGGIKGYLARRHYEVTVQVPAAGNASVRPRPARSRAGIAALLAEADHAEQVLERAAAVPPQVSTASGGFEELVQDLARSTGSLPEAGGARGRRAARVPRPGGQPGDLTVVVGRHADALEVCLSMAREAGGARAGAADDDGSRGVYTGGPSAGQGYLSLANRAGAVAARAAGVEGGYPIFVAWGIEEARGSHGQFAAVTALAADQVWVAVDARMKEADTQAWVAALRAATDIAGMAVQHSAGTGTPESVNRLEVPVGWLDGRPATAPKL